MSKPVQEAVTPSEHCYNFHLQQYHCSDKYMIFYIYWYDVVIIIYIALIT